MKNLTLQFKVAVVLGIFAAIAAVAGFLATRPVARAEHPVASQPVAGPAPGLRPLASSSPGTPRPAAATPPPAPPPAARGRLSKPLDLDGLRMQIVHENPGAPRTQPSPDDLRRFEEGAASEVMPEMMALLQWREVCDILIRRPDLMDWLRQRDQTLQAFVAKPRNPSMEGFIEFQAARKELEAIVWVATQLRTPAAIRLVAPLLYREGERTALYGSDMPTPETPSELAAHGLFYMRIAGLPDGRQAMIDWWEKNKDLPDAAWEKLLREGAAEVARQREQSRAELRANIQKNQHLAPPQRNK